ncbi:MULTISPECIES: hypothetical protein [unclassified Akkermansia]|uniref:hypothetical protein n=2 Tax=unclassified Akkermansia TaxID=2608915 RepID=UPI000B0BBF54|nr:hypothetical protein [Akkermansia sp. KLE1798]
MKPLQKKFLPVPQKYHPVWNVGMKKQSSTGNTTAALVKVSHTPVQEIHLSFSDKFPTGNLDTIKANLGEEQPDRHLEAEERAGAFLLCIEGDKTFPYLAAAEKTEVC